VSLCPPRIGVTGGIASGKSTVSGHLVRFGGGLVDADLAYHNITKPGSSGLNVLSEAFGPRLVRDDGGLDREYLRTLVFSDPKLKKLLEAITHPLIQEEMNRTALEKIECGAAFLVYDIPLLAESGDWRASLDTILVVDCPQELQVSRILARNAWPLESIKKVIAAQSTRECRLKCADYVLFNHEVSFQTLGESVSDFALKFGL
jgi:dephospho-CoA kinase